MTRKGIAMPADSPPLPGASGRDTIAGRSYRVVARRYRPQTFDELVGQSHVVTGLTGALESDRVGHAYLFTGARGVGKTSAARILAKALNCLAGPTTTPCLTCETCQRIAEGDDVDVLEIDGASNRGIDEIRQLRQNVGVRPSRSRYKIYIIDEVHMLTKEAFNALLKTLEEPPAHVKFIFATTEPEKIPATILSRCQRFDFAGIDPIRIRQRLQQIAQLEGAQVDADALDMLARRAGGSMRDSQSLLEQLLGSGQTTITATDVRLLLGLAPAERLDRLVAALVENRPADAIDQLDQAMAAGSEEEQLFGQLIGCFRDVLIASVGCDAKAFLYAAPSDTDRIVALANELGVEKTLSILQILQRTTARFRASRHRRTLAEMALVQIAGLDNFEDLAAVIAELRGGPTAQPPASPPAATAARRRRTVERSDRGQPPAASLRTRQDPAHSSKPATRADRSATPHARPAKEAGGAASPIAKQGETVELRPETAQTVWQEVVQRLSQRSELVADHASLSQELTTSGPQQLVVRFSKKYTSCKAFCEAPEQRAKLERVLHEVTGQPVHLQFGEVDNPGEGPSEQPRRAPASRRQIQLEIGNRPFVRRAMELFDTGQLKVESPQKLSDP